MAIHTTALLAAAAALPPATADLPDATWSTVPRRALLQAESRKAVDTSNQLVVLAGLLSGLALSLIIVTCICLRGRLWATADSFNNRQADRRSRAAALEREQQLAQQQAKLQQLPFVVIMPDNEVSYAHKVCLETATAEAPSKASTGDSKLQLVVAAAAAPETAAADVRDSQQPLSAPGPAVCIPAAGAAAAARAESAGCATAATADAATTPAAEAVAAAAAGHSNSGWQRLQRHYRERAARNAAERAAFQAREAVRLRRRAEQLGWVETEEAAPAEVQPLPAFIEWDVTGSEGPILHPLPPPLPPVEVAPQEPASVAAVHGGSEGSGSGDRGRQLHSGSGRALLAGGRLLAEMLSAAPHAVLDSPSSRQRNSTGGDDCSNHGSGSGGSISTAAVGGNGGV